MKRRNLRSKSKKTVAHKPDPYKLDAEEQEIEDAIGRGEYQPVTGERYEKIANIVSGAAANYLRKDARINIRISNRDLIGLKQLAAKEGLPYQTMIGSILHKVATGAWDDRK